MKKKKTIAIYPGSFDPVTNGHLDILYRASTIFDHVIVAPSETSRKQTLFTLPERISLLKDVVKTKKYRCPISVQPFHGLLINFAKKVKAKVLVRGLRAVSDFDYEFQMALMNRHLASDIETVFLMPDEKYVYLSSSMVKEVGRFKGNLKSIVPSVVYLALLSKFQNQ